VDSVATLGFRNSPTSIAFGAMAAMTFKIPWGTDRE